MRSSCNQNLTLPACLIIMDGFGLAEEGPGNAIASANTPVLDKLFEERPWVKLEASGEAVGLPAGQMGNSEVGHLNIGAGRVVFQELTRIDNACEDGSLEQNAVLIDAFHNVNKTGGVLHIMGLLSDGGVHSSNSHLYALLAAACRYKVNRIFVHCFLDGRDVPPSSGASYIEQLNAEIEKILAEPYAGASPEIIIASLEGRYYAMDRDNRWERVKLAYDTIASCANRVDVSPLEAVRRSYSEDVTDEFLVPVSFVDRGVEDGDSIIFFNFRPDRAREITRAFTDDSFDSFERVNAPRVHFVCLTEYDPDIDAPVAFSKTFPEQVLADCLSDAGLRQFHTAETEKYAHVTFFLNGGVEEPKSGEIRLLVDSPKVATYDLKPEMSEPEVAQGLVHAIMNDEADVYIVNFANCDMVGHTGNIPAAIAAVEAVDTGIGQVLDALQQKRGIAFITADHGNADKMIDTDGSPFTAHTTAPVPFIAVDYSGVGLMFNAIYGDTACGKLADIAPTVLSAIGIEPPSAMTGENLLA